MSKTSENLKNAFAGESQANRTYLAFAKKAEKDGQPQIAKLFRAAAKAETVHALNHLEIIGKTKSTLENLQTAVSGETFEFDEMYPNYIETAKQEGNKKAEWSFNIANQVEQIHATLFSKTIEALQNKTELKDNDYYVCEVCGNTVEGSAPEKCPICGVSKERFERIC
ncbi:MAG: rubrerythrin family protein [Candidatus Bathyarchaeota archaeon]|nr:MAG: rubrerythrin family protein [Candidatus Bathyarchaeota archaeon]